MTAADQSPTNELQTLNNTSTSTTHTATLSNSGGSFQVAEGTGIGLATTGTALDGVVTITNTSPDQTVTITNGGGITVTGTYPNFTLTAADQSATNEIQTISASGAGPTSYNIDLSLSGGSVTINEGANIDLTRSGNNITIASIASTSIYNASDTIFPNCNSRVADNAYWRTNYFSGNRAFEINDLSDYFWIQSDGQESALQLDNTGIVLSVYDAGHTQHGEVFVSPNGAELDFEGNIIIANQYGIECQGIEPFFPPSLTTAERNALFPTLERSFIYNETDTVFQFRQKGAWVTLAGASPDQSVTNEGLLSVITGSPTTSIINSNTGGGSQVVLEAGTNITLSELANTITISASGAQTSQAVEYTSPGTTTVAVPSGAVSFSAVIIGAGGGGGSGRKGAAGNNRYGGGGGAAGAASFGTFSLAGLGSPANITIEVGAGGSGGASITANTTTGNNGTNGQSSLIRISSTTILTASGGTGGTGGSTSSGSGGTVGSLRGDFIGLQAGNGGSTNGASPSQSPLRVPGTGGGGGGLNTSNTTGTGGSGSSGYFALVSGGTGGNGAGPNGADAAAGQYGGGGGAGGGTVSAIKADGGNGGYPGGGGGGGNAGIDSTYDSGAGGTGGNGYVLITWFF